MALPAYSKYRIYVTRTSTSPVNQPSYVTINTFGGYSNGDGSGTDVFVGGSASSKSLYSTRFPSRAFDGNASTEFSSSNENVPQWLRVDLASAVVVRRFYLAATTSAAEVPRDFIIQGSNDGTSWENILQVTDWVTTNVTKTESFRIDLSMSGVSLLDTGGGASKVFLNRYDNGELVKVVVPNAITGEWNTRLQYGGSILITHLGPSGFRPLADGPVTPISE